jgi:hypothetical protein
MDQERHDNDQFKISESDPNNPDTWSGPSMDKPFPGKSVWPKGKRPGKYNTQTGKVSHWDDRIPSERERDWDSMIEGDLEEKAVSKKQQRFMGMVHAAQKGEKPASKAVAKVAKSMGKKDAKDFAATKHKGLPEKVKSDKKKSEEVEETTTSGAVATSTDAPKGGKKGGMQFGKGVYEAYNQRLEDTINESMDINVSTSSEGRKSISVTATDEDAMALAKLLTLSGLTGHMSSDSEEVCPGCGSADCGCEQMDEDYSNSPEQEYRGTEYMTKTIAGGLNGPHMQVNPNNMGDNPLAMDKLAHKQAAQVNLGPIGDMNESKKIESNLWNLYSEVKQK